MHGVDRERVDQQAASLLTCLTKFRPALEVTPGEAYAWALAAEEASTAYSWSEVAEWGEVGVRTPDQRPSGLHRHDVAALIHAGVADRSPEWDDAQSVCPTFIRLGVDLGKPPEAIRALFLAPFRPYFTDENCAHEDDPPFYCLSTVQTTARALAAGRALHDVDWDDAYDCLLAGMSVDETGAYLRTGGDMEAVRVMLALTWT